MWCPVLGDTEPGATRDWIKDWDLDAWQRLDPTDRQRWIHDVAWGDPRGDDEDYKVKVQRWHRESRREQMRKESYFLGRTAWDIGLEPQPFTVALSQAIDKVKPEHWDGVVFGNRDLRTRVLSALLANAGVRRAAQLIPRQLLLEQLETKPKEHHYPEQPVTRPEFVKVTTPYDDAYWFAWRRLDMDADYKRQMPLWYLQVDDFTWARCEAVILREPWDSKSRPPFRASAVDQIIDIAVRRSQAEFDFEVRRPAFLAAGAGDYRLIDLSGDEELSGAEPNFDVEAFDTPWTIGHTPQWFSSDLTSLVGRFRDELWAGTLFGSPEARDEILSLLIANVGLYETFRLVPRRQLWEAALS
jgi:hypothetical protein